MPAAKQEAIRADVDGNNQHPYYNPDGDATARHRVSTETTHIALANTVAPERS